MRSAKDRRGQVLSAVARARRSSALRSVEIATPTGARARAAAPRRRGYPSRGLPAAAEAGTLYRYETADGRVVYSNLPIDKLSVTVREMLAESQ